MLLVDVDGVLSPFAAASCPAGFVEVAARGFVLRLCAEHGVWLRRLADRFELVWATTWEDDAATLIAPQLALPDMPIIHFGGRGASWGPTWKLPAVAAAVGDRAAAWVDDDLHDDAVAWARQRPVPTLLLPVDPSIGLTAEHVATLEDWADRCLGPT